MTDLHSKALEKGGSSRHLASTDVFPVTFDGMVGHVHAATGSTGLVFCGPWGFDALCTVKFHRLIAVALAKHAISSIRFDYPGEGDSLPLADGASVESWVASANLAANELRMRTGCSQILYYGMGIGAAIAVRAGLRDKDLSGLVLAGAALNGRRYLREVALREKVIEDGIDINFSYPPEATVLAAFIMDQRLAADVKSLNISLEDLPPELPVLVLQRPQNQIDSQILETLAKAGVVADALDFEGYGAMLDGVVTSPMPTQLIERVADWVSRAVSSVALRASPLSSPYLPRELVGQGFRETPQLLNSNLFGVICEPETEPSKAVIVFLNMAYAPHIGWGAIWVEAARSLARKGIATLRVDLSSIGDSPAHPDGPDQVIYSARQLDDVAHVIRHVRGRTSRPILLAGSCSGAHSALNASAQSKDVDGVVSINQLRLILDPHEDIESALKAGARPLSDYRRRAFSMTTYRRIVSGQVDLIKAVQHLSAYAGERLSRAVSPFAGRMTRLGRLKSELFDLLKGLERQNVQVTFVSCRTDGSLDQHTLYFGKDLRGMAAFGNVSHIILENADHTLSPPPVRAQVIEILQRAAENCLSKR